MNYEQLLELDDNPYEVGNGLEEHKRGEFPTYVMQQESKENCAICMDKIMVGETAKRLE